MNLLQRPWQVFFDERIRLMCTSATRLLDIGAGLRLSKAYGNRADASHAWIGALLKEHEVEYVVLDYVDTYHPHIVGDIQQLPLEDNSEQSITCLAILEHVENPFLAFSELHRVLRPGGQCLLYVPFLYYYHAESTYYRDYWRFTRDSLASLCASFSTVEIQNVRGPIETLIRLSPLGRYSPMTNMGFMLDSAFGKLSSPQTSGYYVWLSK